MTVSSTSDDARAGDGTSARCAWWVAGIGCAAALLCSLIADAAGPIHVDTEGPARGVFLYLLALVAAFCIAMFIALRRARPRPLGAWVLLALGALAIVGEAVQQLLPSVSDGDVMNPTNCLRTCGLPPGPGVSGFFTNTGAAATPWGWFLPWRHLTVSWFGTKLVFPVSAGAMHVGRLASWLLPIVGAGCMLLGVRKLFRARCGRSGRRLELDIALVAAVSGLLAWSLLFEPARVKDTFSAPSFIAVPVLDFVAAWFLLLLALTMRRRSTAGRFLSASLALHLVASVMTWYTLNFQYPPINDRLDVFWFRAALGIYVASAAFCAAAALHPSARDFGRVDRSDVVPADAMRYQLLVGLGLCAVAVDTTIRPLAAERSRVVVSITSVLLVVIVLQRAWRATTAQLSADRKEKELNATLSTALGRLATAESDERRRIARDLHDTVVQDLVAMRWQFAELSAESDVERVTSDLSRLSEQLVEITRTARSLSHRLEAPVSDAPGLEAALRSEVLALRSTRLDIDLRCAFAADLDGEVAALAFRTVREALRNVVRHASAGHASVVLTSDDEWLRCEVRDDGVGIDPDAMEARAREGHIGVASMRDGAVAVGGTFRIASEAPHGTVVRFEVPLRVTGQQGDEPTSARRPARSPS